MNVCAEPGCPALINTRYCRKHTRVQRSEEGLIAQRWYRSKRWKKKRAEQLRQHPYCQCPEHKGQRVKATVADHIIPHRGNYNSFWNGPLQSLAKRCHDSWKQSSERVSTESRG